ncbi:LADA_0E07360g1_1 [Lachancea dasiensis]|uniref:LADA_0E07360g1_1 n=1 Tax=Lachancea dasiensis TaxID=1072105 RepID=A0A1G4JCV8_9SACH|nr:LADA_0E07360g1_1 [Lachancea dasiensis]
MSQIYTLSDQDDDPNLAMVTRGVVRHLMSLSESQSNVFSRTKLTTLVREAASKETSRKLRFAVVFAQINEILSTTFGYELVGVHTKTMAPGWTPDRAQLFMLVSKMPTPPPSFEALLLQEASQMYESRMVGDEYVGDDLGTISESGMHNAVSTDAHLVAQGLTLAVLTIVLLSKNNVHQEELKEAMVEFGVHSENFRLPVLDLTLDEFLKNLVKQEYLRCTEETAQDGVRLAVIYGIGRRTQVEFDKASLLGACTEIMELDPVRAAQLEPILELSIGDAYTEIS